MTDSSASEARQSVQAPRYAALRVLLYLLAILVVYIISQTIIVIASALLAGLSLESQIDITNSVGIWAAGFLVTAFVVIMLTLVFVVYWDKRSAETLGFARRGTWAAEITAGGILGLLLPALMFVASLSAGWTRIAGSAFSLSPGKASYVVAASALLMVFIAVTEETVMRGYVLQTLRWKYGTAVGLVVSSLIFGAAHLAGPDRSLAPFIGTGLAGFMLGYAYLSTGRLWMPIGLHFGWNLALGPLLGFPVSGIRITGWVIQEFRGPALWTGGIFGPEACLLGWLAIGLGLLAIWAFSFLVRDPGPVQMVGKKELAEEEEAPPPRD